MCGICGVIDLQKSTRVSRSVLHRMNERLAHRGPDDSGLYLDRYVGLGHRRLAVIDPGRGQQPFANTDGSVWVTYNGEIYNHRQLRDELVALGHRFTTSCDTEVLVHAYEELGADCVSRFNGMFAFAVWDRRNETLLLARDRLGIKPLYYLLSGRHLIFASEIKAILAHPLVRTEVELAAIPEYLLCTTLLGSKTMFKGVRALPPASMISVRDADVTEHHYWRLGQDCAPHRPSTMEELAESIRSHLDSAVSLRVMSDVPFGTLLSGGLDSSLVSALASAHVPGRLKTFAMGYEANASLRAEGTDTHFAGLVARAYDTDHLELVFRPDDYYRVMSKVSWHVEWPVDLTTPSLYLLYQQVKPHVTVVTSGEGADELFAGYDFFLERYRTALPTEFPWAPYLEQVSTLLDPAIERRTGFMETARSALSRSLAELETSDGLNKVLYLFLKHYLVAMLERLDKASMAWGVESRVPFLDHHLVEHVLHIPSAYKLDASSPKRLLKQAAAELLPAEILERKKRPVPIPVDPKTVLDLRRRANQLVQSAGSRISGYLDKKKVNDFFNRQGSYARHDSLAVYRTAHALIALDSWHQAFGIGQ